MHADRQAIQGTGVEFTGRLVRDAEARHKLIDGNGHDVPVVILDLESDSGMHMPLHVEQPFPLGHWAQAQAAARRYRKGQRVTVLASALSVRMAVTATHVHTEKEETDPV
jgi:hypothetical protein